MQKNNLKQILSRLCITQAEFARMIRVSPPKVCRMCVRKSLNDYDKYIIKKNWGDEIIDEVIKHIEAGTLPKQMLSKKQQRYVDKITALEPGQHVVFRSPYEFEFIVKQTKKKGKRFIMKANKDNVRVIREK